MNYSLVLPAWVTVKVGAITGALSEFRRLVDNDPRPAANNSDQWDGLDDLAKIVPPYTYHFYVWANILPDNAIVIRADPSFKIDTVRVNPYAIYPVYGDAAIIDYKITGSAVVNIDILDPNGIVIRKLVINKSVTAGVLNTVTWDGKDDAKKIVVTPGNYQARVTALNSSGSIKKIRYGNITILK